MPRASQTLALLLRTWHYQRRRHYDNFCTFILPPLLLVLLTVLARVIPGREVDALAFQQDPGGAFAPLPFRPDSCRESALDLSNGIDFDDVDREDLEKSARACLAEPFVPNPWEVLYAGDGGVGELDAAKNEREGILGGVSLTPFIYPGVVDGTFTGTSYDSVFRSEYFPDTGNATVDAGVDRVYQRFITTESTPGGTDKNYASVAVQLPSKTALLDRIYDMWFLGGSYDSFSSAYYFNSVAQNADTVAVDATVYYNESRTSNCTQQCQIASGVMRLENAIFQDAVPGKTATAFLRRFPPISVELDNGTLKLIISIVLGLTMHYLLPTFMRFLVFERVARLRSMMGMMGLKHVQYWFGTYLGLLLQFLITTATTTVFGIALDIPFFTDNFKPAYLVLFFLWGNVLVAFAIFLAPFFRRPETAVIMGWLIVILINIVGGPYLGTRLSSDSTSEGTWAAIMLLPSFAFLRSVYYAGAMNGGGRGVVAGSEIFNRTELGMCRGDGPFCRSYIFLGVQWFLLMIAGLYLDLVLPTAGGTRLHPLFMFGFKRGATKRKISDSLEDDYELGQGRPMDVAAEEERVDAIVATMDNAPFDGLVLQSLSKTYHTAQPPGHNGAGKSTAFQTLVGELEPTSGNAWIHGDSIVSDMDKVRRSMGVTPQENILWDSLTCDEHLYFYGRLKGLKGADLKSAVTRSLASVQLLFARGRRAEACSGGMKRRLSVAIAMVGEPSFLILDEPSTGLDILAREKLWQSIEKAKGGKTILLTTHSLEEAEALSDRVAIMSRGQLMCIGTAEELKQRLGTGYHLSIAVPESKIAELHREMMRVAPGSVIGTQLGGNVEYTLPKSFPLAAIFEMIETHRTSLQIVDYSLNTSSLEDVFLAVTTRAQRAYAAKKDAEI